MADGKAAKTEIPRTALAEEAEAATEAGLGASQATASTPSPKVVRNRPAKKPQPEAPPRGNNLLVVGLGNPGDRFKYTRHNAGFLVVEELARRYGATFKIKSAFMVSAAAACRNIDD